MHVLGDLMQMWFAGSSKGSTKGNDNRVNTVGGDDSSLSGETLKYYKAF